MIAASLSSTSGFAQTSEDIRARFRKMSEEAEGAGWPSRSRGSRPTAMLFQGLFPIRSTGVSTEPVRKAADAFLASLDAGAAREDRVRRRRCRVAQVDEPAFLYAPGRQLQGDERGAARSGLRAAARVAQRQGIAADARHHAAEPHPRRAEQQRLRGISASGSIGSR